MTKLFGSMDYILNIAYSLILNKLYLLTISLEHVD